MKTTATTVSNPRLTGSHLRTYKTIFQHPISHNLGWHDVHELSATSGRLMRNPTAT